MVLFSSTRRRIRHLAVCGWIVAAVELLSSVPKVAGGDCERLKRSLTTYTQEEAPKDLSGVLPVVVARVNQELEGVVNVEVNYNGDDLQGRVGEHLVTCEVTRLASVLSAEQRQDEAVILQEDEFGRPTVSQCFVVPFTILDTNECTLPLHHPLRHQCQSPAVCVNTNGSYECVCPRVVGGAVAGADGGKGTAATTMVDDQYWLDLQAEQRGPWEMSYNTSSRTSCPSLPSTHGCCPERANTKDAMACRRSFACPQNPCTFVSTATTAPNDCADEAVCVRKSSPNVELPNKNYQCQCPDGLMGNGHKCRPGVDPLPAPKVRFDGKTPTEETVQNNYYCGCTKPVVDACSGFPPCKGKHEICVVSASNVPQCGCKSGYVMHEKYGCVDESPPVMKLRHDVQGDQTLRLKQGDVYQEHAVDIVDENAEAYMRSLKIAYSRPLPHGCLTKVGEFHVNYTIATPWTSPTRVLLTRRVVIEDIDECAPDVTAKFQKDCPALVPQCDAAAGAKCVNKVGTYTCQCPQYTTGDGFLSGLYFANDDAPMGYAGGNGCVDTSKPVIELNGPNPKVFRISQCGVLSGILDSKKDDRDADLKAAQRKHYGDDIRAMIQRTAGAELCATHDVPNPDAGDCVVAYDDTYKGRVDLSKTVVVGDPVQTSELRWRVPYNVRDAAGNEADTVYRDVVVEEVDLMDMESKIRQDILKDKNAEVRKAVDKALAEERKKGGAAINQQRATSKLDCPKCPPCICADDKDSSFDPSMCDAVCENQQPPQATCEATTPSATGNLSLGVQTMIWLEGFLPQQLAAGLFFLIGFYVFFVIATGVGRLLFAPPRYAPAYNAAEREQGMQNHITVYTPPSAQQQQQHPPEQQNGIGNASPAWPPTSSAYGNPPSQATNGPPTNSSSLYGDPARLFSPTPWSQQAPDTAFGSPSNGTSQHQPPPDIYATSRSPIITPSRKGEGVRTRSPYGR